MARPEPQDDKEDEEQALPHSEAVDVFQEGLAMVVQDPLLCDLPIQVTLEEVNSQIALEYGQAMTVRVCKMDGEVMPVVVVQNATVLDLKKAIQRYVQLRQEREGGIQHISWSYVWRTYHLTSAGEKLTEDRKKLRDYGIRNRDEVSFIKKLRQKRISRLGQLSVRAAELFPGRRKPWATVPFPQTGGREPDPSWTRLDS